VEMARRHVEQRESYRVLAKRALEVSGRKISPTAVNGMVSEVARRCKEPLEMSAELHPRWKGYLLLDEKMVSVRGRQLWFYLGVDSGGDIVHCRAVKELTATEAMGFIREIIDDAAYRVRGVTTDLDTSLRIAVERILPGIAHQVCLKHVISALEDAIGYRQVRQRQGWNKGTLRREFEKLGSKKGIWVEKARRGFFDAYGEYRKFSLRHRQIEALRKTMYGIVFARTRAGALEQVKRFKRDRPPSMFRAEKRKVVNFLNRYFDQMMIYHSHPGMPRTTNFVENVNKQIQRRIKTIEAFQSRSGASAYMNLLIAYLRQKPYTDCRGKRKYLNGLSRLEAAGVSLPSTDWLKNSLNK
jgi:transposase-like protein